MKEYIAGARTIINKGSRMEPARAGMIGTRDYTSLQLRFDLSKGTIPILTTKEVDFKNVVAELLWFLRGQTNIRELKKYNCNIWDDNAWEWYKQLEANENIGFGFTDKSMFLAEAIKEDRKSIRRRNGEYYTTGDLGRIYSYQWRGRKIDQIRDCIRKLVTNPSSRQNKVVGWVPEDMTYEYCAQPNCHGDFTINARKLNGAARLKLLKERLKQDNVTFSPDDINDKLKKYNVPTHEFTLSLQQRSGDYALGIPYNITSYGVLMYIIGILTNTVPRMLIMTINSAHIYNDHIETLKEQINRKPKEQPRLKIITREFLELAAVESPSFKDLDFFLAGLTPNDFELVGYNPAPKVKFKLHTGTLVKKK